jgi:multidrug transporter EmrE-like cation transporter
MVIISSVLVALLIVGGQALWKASVNNVTEHHLQLLSSAGLVQLIRSPKLYLGILVYGIATVAYIFLLSKYKYFQVQSVVVGGSIILTLLIASIFFHEQVNAANLVGVALLVCGVILVTR